MEYIIKSPFVSLYSISLSGTNMKFLKFKLDQAILLKNLQWLPGTHGVKFKLLNVGSIIPYCFGFSLPFSGILSGKPWMSPTGPLDVAYQVFSSIFFSPQLLLLCFLSYFNDIISHSNSKSHNRLLILSPSMSASSNLKPYLWERDPASSFTGKVTPCEFLVLYIQKGLVHSREVMYKLAQNPEGMSVKALSFSL